MVRPPKKPEHKRSEYLQLRMTADEKACTKAGAKISGQPWSKFIRTAAVEKATLITQAAQRADKRAKTNGGDESPPPAKPRHKPA